MGRLRKVGRELLVQLYRSKPVIAGIRDADLVNVDRVAQILGTGWSEPDVLRDLGFQLEAEIPFSRVGLDVGEGAGHPNRFLLGTWHDQQVVISQGRIHLYQERPVRESLIRKWMSVLLALMGRGTRIIITSSVGGVSKAAKTGTVVLPTGIVSAHLPQPYLNGDEAEFVMSEHLLWITHEESGIDREEDVQDTFLEAAIKANLSCIAPGTHMVVPGPGFGGATERKLWASWGCDTVGMSLDPELRLIALENMDNGADDAPENAPDPIQVFAAFIVTDDHDLPKHKEITAAAKERAPQLGTFLSHVVAADW